MIINFDRVVAIVSLGVGVGSIGIGVALTDAPKNAQIISLSGWAASFAITLLLSISAFIVIGKFERRIEKISDDLLSKEEELINYRNISIALTSVINPEPMIQNIRNNLAAHMAKNQPDEDA
ncbi:hypothetical protein [Herbaspirillum sp. VT-16-41]|uniref:hypothetical protein n=1 Tax=Herbaspirillum sp. VT-16-41 TaxID=1953765 RepID=UPI0009809313|nr:hypothetical protein [Herbaspirillum sp. VT-16-41]ONN66840.1 hypothetical protein BTM36_09900 [Herbaspirillum sp. VT-16-41]